MRLLRTKSIDAMLAEPGPDEQRLKRVLGPLDLTVLGIGAIVGAGIFALVGTAAAGDAARPGAGPALVLSFVLTAAACGLTALCYAELASLVPISGSAYTYDLCNIGTLSAFLIVCAGVLVLRRREPGRPRGFTTPWLPWVPLLGILACLWLMLGLPWTAWIRFGVWLAAGIAFYALYGYRTSRLDRGTSSG
jgi:amino acid transporter